MVFITGFAVTFVVFFKSARVAVISGSGEVDCCKILVVDRVAILLLLLLLVSL